jgi:heterotetrameric sarcosine oxidase gamma subunit
VSEALTSHWHRRSAWSGILMAGRLGKLDGEPGVVTRSVEPGAVATVMAGAAGAQRLDSYFANTQALTPPRSPGVAASPGCALVWTGPGQWLALSADPALRARLATDLEGCAAVADQSGARAILHVSGPHWRDALAKGCPIDLHPRAFKRGDAAVTAISHVGVLLWQLSDDTGLHVAVPRGMAGSFWSWLAGSAAELGLEVVAPDAQRS